MKLIYCAVLFYFLGQVVAEQCISSIPCSCKTDGFDLNLGQMMVRNREPLRAQGNGATFYLDPCGNQVTVNPCQTLKTVASGCQVAAGVPYGTATRNSFSATGDPKAGSVMFQYSYAVGVNRRVILMNLECSSEEREFSFVTEYPTRTYKFLLKTKYACFPTDSGGLSTGSVLLIIFFVLLIIYIVGGILFMKYFQKAEGLEVIPNVGFWKELPLLIKYMSDAYQEYYTPYYLVESGIMRFVRGVFSFRKMRWICVYYLQIQEGYNISADIMLT